MRVNTFFKFCIPNKNSEGFLQVSLRSFVMIRHWFKHSKICQLYSKLADRGSPVVSFINRVIVFPKCRIARNGISRYSLSCVCRSVSDKVPIIPSFSSFSLFVILYDIFIAGHALECYVCTDQEGNRDKCLNTIKTCEQGQDSCLTEIKWGSKYIVCILHGLFLRLCELLLKHVLFICVFT